MVIIMRICSLGARILAELDDRVKGVAVGAVEITMDELLVIAGHGVQISVVETAFATRFRPDSLAW